ncbi:MAG: hypothetical protein KatS3mg001_206 [Candidatus Pacearchaeota archaeon]|nr:MAG: hypothetical protein KatS3mg001_206 [Candidatus Pacearchaeota archaeon]
MKRALYSIDDEEFLTFLERIDHSFRTNNIPYLFVGGVATQAHIVSLICKKEGVNLYDLINDPNFRVQDHLRATDDIDITLDIRNIEGQKTEIYERINTILSSLEEESPYVSVSGNHLVSVKLERKGIRRPVFRLGLDEEPSYENEVSLNLYYSPEDTNHRWSQEMIEFERQNYFRFFESGLRISLPIYKGKKIELNVKSLEDLIATKIARSREKDWTDILLLYRHTKDSGNPINFSQLERDLYVEDERLKIFNEELINRLKKFKVLVS